MMNIENYKKKLESMSREELLHEISNLISDHGIQLQNKSIGLQHLKPNTIEIGGCEHIYLTQFGIDVKFELNNDKLKKFKQMYINGIRFLRSEAFFEELEDRLPKNKKLDRYDVLDIIQDLLEEWKQ